MRKLEKLQVIATVLVSVEVFENKVYRNGPRRRRRARRARDARQRQHGAPAVQQTPRVDATAAFRLDFGRARVPSLQAGAR